MVVVFDKFNATYKKRLSMASHNALPEHYLIVIWDDPIVQTQQWKSVYIEIDFLL